MTSPINRALGTAHAAGQISDESPNAGRLRMMGITLGLLFVLFVAADYLFRPTFVSINVDSDETSRATPMMVSAIHLFVQFAVALPILRIVMIDRIDLRRLYPYTLACGAVLFFGIISLIAHPETKASVNLITLAWSFAIFGLLAASDYGRGLCIRDAFAAISIGSGILLVVVAVEAEYSWGRLAGRVGPNYWGMISFIAFVTSFALPRWWQRLPLWVAAIYVLDQTSARGSLLALIISGGVVYALSVWHAPRRRRGWIILPLIALAILLPIIVPIVAVDVLMLDDARRGVGSGGTGRSIAWGQAFALFKAHPWLGVGFRQHRQYITIASSAHNAYLAALAEIGLPGLIAYLCFLFGATVGAVRRALRQSEIYLAAVAGFFVSYILFGLIESIWLTLGSPLPFLMVLLAAQAWTGSRSDEDRSKRGVHLHPPTPRGPQPRVGPESHRRIKIGRTA